MRGLADTVYGLRRPANVLLSLLLVGLMSCSSIREQLGRPDPDFSEFDIGSSRKQVDIRLGVPVSSRQLEGGKREDTYEFEYGFSKRRTIVVYSANDKVTSISGFKPPPEDPVTRRAREEQRRATRPQKKNSAPVQEQLVVEEDMPPGGLIPK